jgi:hypothetical protein
MNQIVKAESFSLTPKNLDEAMKFADILAKSTIVPKGYQGRPGDILVAVQMGAEVGLKPIQALQNIAVINGKPSIYGDACLALVKAHLAFEDIKEYYIDETETAVCEIKRKGQSSHKTTFSRKDAEKAGLWGKAGPWTQYTKRMQQMRARGFNVRDTFPDALQGLILAEEAQDYPMEDVTPTPPVSNAPKVSKAEKLANLIAGTNDMVDVDKTEIKKMMDSILETEIPRSISPLALELQDLIIERDVPKKTTDFWLESAGVKTLAELDEEKLAKCINYIQEKFKQAA